jgi:uncharacterized protein YggE
LLVAQNRQHAVLEHCERELETLARSQKASSDNMADLQLAVEENTRTAEDVRTEIENVRRSASLFLALFRPFVAGFSGRLRSAPMP